jgi:hypothetical protein
MRLLREGAVLALVGWMPVDGAAPAKAVGDTLGWWVALVRDGG